jgi:hypothetical protein
MRRLIAFILLLLLFSAGCKSLNFWGPPDEKETERRAKTNYRGGSG